MVLFTPVGGFIEGSVTKKMWPENRSKKRVIIFSRVSEVWQVIIWNIFNEGLGNWKIISDQWQDGYEWLNYL